MYSVSLQDVYNEQTICNIKKVDNDLTELRNNQWKEYLPSKPKLCTYITFKNVYIEDYVKCCGILRRGEEEHC